MGLSFHCWLQSLGHSRFHLHGWLRQRPNADLQWMEAFTVMSELENSLTIRQYVAVTFGFGRIECKEIL